MEWRCSNRGVTESAAANLAQTSLGNKGAFDRPNGLNNQAKCNLNLDIHRFELACHIRVANNRGSGPVEPPVALECPCQARTGTRKIIQ